LKKIDTFFTLSKKLDLNDHLTKLQSFFSREKPLFLEGDRNRNFRFIEALERNNFNAPPQVKNLDSELMHLKKLGTLGLDQIFEFVKVVRYMGYLQSIPFDMIMSEWLRKIDIPEYFDEIDNYFDHEGNFNEDIDERFASLNQTLHHIEEEIKESLRRLLFSKKMDPYLADKQIHFYNGEETLLVRGGFNHVLKATVVGRSSGGFFYVVPQSINTLQSKRLQTERKKEALFIEYAGVISKQFHKLQPFLKFINHTFDQFDHYQARHFFASSADLSVINTEKSQKVVLDSFAHPALHKPKPVSIDFSKKILMITGVNAGGKTMLLKSLLSAVFMAKHLIPMKIKAETSVIGHFKNLFAIIDDPQSVQNDISTFAGRMLEFSTILREEKSLIGVDEVELGTDSDEAAALFKVLLEQLMKKGSKVVITTHHKRLASLMGFHEDVELIAALYDEKERQPRYEFLQGIIGKSYAFETALRYGIDPQFVKQARTVYGEDQEHLNELIEKSSNLELELKQKSRELDERLAQVKEQTRLLEEAKEAYEDGLHHKKDELKALYRGAIGEAKRAVKAKTIPDAHRAMTNAHKQLPARDGIKKVSEALKVGDYVKYGKTTTGVIESINGKKAFIDVNGMRLQAPLYSLKRIDEKPVEKAPQVSVKKPSEGLKSLKIDLHGMRADEANEILDKSVSDALISGVDELWVYHGVGTGKLAYAVKTFLQAHPKVIEFIDAPAHMGGSGAKIVKL
jgi:DNA mismatch repair protein MutS2